jgi:phosphoesterase RecJ-like protein
VLDLAKYSKELSKLFELSDNILLISHINPDGDTIGSQLALYRFLLTKGKIAAMISPNYLQEFLKWMDGSDLIKIFIKERAFCKKLIQEADLIIMVDYNQPNRMGEAEKYVKASAAPKVIIDHHIDPHDIADLLISDTSKCSTAELVHELVTIINGKPFTEKSYAEDIYVGIITDTGNFEYGTYSGSTLRLVADLLETGIEKEKILRSIYYNFTADRMRLQGFALNNRMVVLQEYGAAYIYLAKKDLAEYNHVNGDTEGFVNLPLSIKGIRFSVLFIEKENFVKMSFRSRGNFAVNEFATKYFSGGGHLNASGGEFQGTLENAVAYFLNILKENEDLFKNQL